MRRISLLAGIVISVIWISSCTENINPPEVENHDFYVDENSSPGTMVGVVIAYDMDPGQSVSFEFRKGNEEGTFEIDASGGHISVADPELLNYEIHTQIDLSVLVTDDHPKDPKSSIANITVFLNDLNEYAPVMEDQNFEINEHPSKDDLIGTIQAIDPETHQSLQFTLLSGNEPEIVSLDSDSGALTVSDTSAFDYDLNQQLLFTAQVRDLHLDSKTDTAVITIQIKEVI